MSDKSSFVTRVLTGGKSFWNQKGAEDTATSSRKTTKSDGYRITSVHISDLSEQEETKQAPALAALSPVERRETWSWGITTWNVIAFLLCPGCIYCMFGALLCNVFAYVDYKAGDFARQRYKLMCAVGWSVTCFVIAIVTIIVIIIVLFVVFDAQNWTTIPTQPGSDFTM